MEIRIPAEVCQQCGQPTTWEKKCPHCGHKELTHETISASRERWEEAHRLVIEAEKNSLR